MKKPEIIEFHNDCKTVLCKSLQVVWPQEGCSILLGIKTTNGKLIKKNIWQVKYIWPCSNAWESETFPLAEPQTISKHCPRIISPSKANRFSIEPREQLAAQHWGKARDYQILASAHSHPQGDNKPSKIDLKWHCCPGLMVIISESGQLAAWWIENEQNFHQIKLS